MNTTTRIGHSSAATSRSNVLDSKQIDDDISSGLATLKVSNKQQQPPTVPSPLDKAKIGLTYALTGADESAGILLGYLDAYACARSMRNGNARVRFQDGLVAFFAEETGGVIHVDAVIRHVKDLVDANEWKTFHAEYMQKLTDGAASNDGSSSSMS